VLLASCLVSAAAYAATDIEGLMDSFQKATDLQRQAIIKDNLNREISAAGKISNVGEYDFFDIVNDIKGTYYQVSLEQQKTKGNTPYQVIFLFKDRDKVKDLNKGQNFQKDGQVIRIIDERLQVSLWLFCGELTEADKALFSKS
jgi:hypothetical protein